MKMIQSGEIPFSEALRKMDESIEKEAAAFVALIGSKWHALGLVAWLNDLAARGEKRCGYVLLLPHAVGGFSVREEDFPETNYEGEVRVLPIRSTGISGIMDFFRRAVRMSYLIAFAKRGRRAKDNPPLYFVSSRAPIFSVLTALKTVPILKRYALKFVEIDEGLSVYFPRSTWIKIALKTVAGDQPLKRFFRYFKAVLLEHLIFPAFDFIAADISLEKRRLFNLGPNSGHLLPRHEICESYRDALARFPSVSEGIRRTGRTVLMLTQPLAEEGQWSREDENAFLRKVVSRWNERGYDVWIKPHPREAPDKYDSLLLASAFGLRVSVLKMNCLVERLFPVLREEDIVLGYTSTALFTASALFDLKSYSVARQILTEGCSGSFFREHCQAIEKRAGDLVSDLTV